MNTCLVGGKKKNLLFSSNDPGVKNSMEWGRAGGVWTGLGCVCVCVRLSPSLYVQTCQKLPPLDNSVLGLSRIQLTHKDQRANHPTGARSLCCLNKALQSTVVTKRASTSSNCAQPSKNIWQISSAPSIGCSSGGHPTCGSPKQD